MWQNGTVSEAILRPLGAKTFLGGFCPVLEGKCDSSQAVENFFYVNKFFFKYYQSL